MKRKIYVETAVISYLTARPSKNVIEAGHQQSTYLFWDRRSEFDLVASELVVMECNAGDPVAANKRHDALSGIPLLDITALSVELAKGLVPAGVVPATASEDALHIAIATVHFVDYPLTWNCRHIANPENSGEDRRAFAAAWLVPAFHLHPRRTLGRRR